MNSNSYLDENLIVDLTFEFANEIIDFSEQLKATKNYILQDQLLRCGTSIGAQVREAQNAESIADFIHKFKIAAKEADEARYWLLLCNHSNYPDPNNLWIKLESSQKIINHIISSTNKKMK